MVQDPEDRLLFSVAGARGIVGKSFNVDVATRLGLAFCSILPGGSVVVGRDTRPSGEALMTAVVGAVMATGRECIDVGIAATPTVEMTVEKLGAAGGIIVTASHNPIEWNALKFLDARGIFINQTEGERLLETYTRGDFNYVDAVSTGKRTPYELAARDHIDAILGMHSIDVEKIIHRSFKVVLDCINGAGSVIAPQLLRDFGAGEGTGL